MMQVVKKNRYELFKDFQQSTFKSHPVGKFESRNSLV